MIKRLLNDKEDFEKWKKSISHHVLIENGEEQPSNYPCIVVDKYVVDFYVKDKDYLYYMFVYLEDFKNDK